MRVSWLKFGLSLAFFVGGVSYAQDPLNPRAPFPFQYGMTQDCSNCLCALMMSRGSNGETERALAEMRAHRISVLRSPMVEPRLVRNFSLDNSAKDKDIKRLAEHIRGIEIWTQSSFQERAGEPKISGRIFTGSTEIEGYYKAMENMRVLIRQAATSDPSHVLRMFKRAAQANAGTLFMLTFSALDGFMQYSGVGNLPIPWWATLAAIPVIDPVAFHRFRWQRDSLRTKFDEQLSHYMQETPDQQSTKWIFSSKVYRVQWQTIDGTTSGDSTAATVVIREQTFIDAYGAIMRWVAQMQNRVDDPTLGRRLQDGWVIVDHLLRYNPIAEAPELVVAVRTIARNPRNAAPVTDASAKFNWSLQSGVATPVPGQ